MDSGPSNDIFTLREMAIWLNELYLSLTAAGWVREDALDLIAKIVTQGKK